MNGFIYIESCDTGWYSHDDACFIFTKEQLPFDLASEQCKQHNGYLTTIINEREKHFLVDTWSGMHLQEITQSWYVFVMKIKITFPEELITGLNLLKLILRKINELNN